MASALAWRWSPRSPTPPVLTDAIAGSTYMRRGQREVLERLSCDSHVAEFARQFHVELGPAPEGAESG
jgi:hypothetical protein